MNITARQKEILFLIAQGHTSEEIARKLGNSKKTIDAMRIDMMRRAGAKNTSHLVYIGFLKGWIEKG